MIYLFNCVYVWPHDSLGYVVAQLFEALHYKLAGCGFNFW